MDLQGKKAVVIGLALSGIASAKLLLEKGAQVTINDRKSNEDALKELKDLAGTNYSYVGGGHPEELVTNDVALVVKNPGIPFNLPPVKKAMELGIPIISEVELASWFITAPIVAITGTNGKTTTTALTGEIYRAAGRKTYVVGNIGLPISAVAQEIGTEDVVVAELSSFQLEGIIDFRPKLSAILNITPDHLDRHGTMEAYTSAKANIFKNQKSSDALILNADDANTFSLREQPACSVYLFSRLKPVLQGAFIRDEKIILKDKTLEEELCKTNEIFLPGAFNLENAMAAALLAWLGGVSTTVIRETLKTFRGVAHRLELVGEVDGVKFVNNSKGTNTDSTVKALEAFKERKILIAGGYDKGGTFEELAASIKKHAHHVVLLGQVKEKIAAALDEAGFKSYVFARSIEEAAAFAYQEAKKKDIVLLSPACASWDMFANFEERGDRFKQAVWELGRQKNESNGNSQS